MSLLLLVELFLQSVNLRTLLLDSGFQILRLERVVVFDSGLCFLEVFGL